MTKCLDADDVPRPAGRHDAAAGKGRWPITAGCDGLWPAWQDNSILGQTIVIWGDTREPLEERAELLHAGETEVPRHIYGTAATVEQQAFGELHLPQADVGGKRLARLKLEEIGKVGF